MLRHLLARAGLVAPASRLRAALADLAARAHPANRAHDRRQRATLEAFAQRLSRRGR